MNLENPADFDLENSDEFDRLDELLSLFFDDCLSAEQAAELNQIMLTDPAARSRSVDAAQLHADLYWFFREKKGAAAPVMPALGLPIPGLTLPTMH